MRRIAGSPVPACLAKGLARSPLACLHVWLAACLAACLLAGCDEGAPTPADLGVGPVPAGLFESCTPGLQDPPCAAGLRCSLVLVGDPPYQGVVTQCVPLPPAPIAEDQPCALDQEAQGGNGGEGRLPKRFDRCGADQGCALTRSGLRCRQLCPLRQPGSCKSGQLCVLPAQVDSVGYCAAPDRCQAVPPQKGCPAGGDGQPLPCYALTESAIKGRPRPQGGSFCVPFSPLGDSDGTLGSRCERSANCRAGLSCARPEGAEALSCRPYCEGSRDGGADGGPARCAGDLGTCQPIANYEQVGRCL